MAGKKEVKKKRKPQGGKTGKVIAAFLLYFTMAVMGYALFTAPPQGTPMAYVRSALCGLGGKVAIAIPLMLGWAGTLCALKAAGRKVPAWKAMLDGVLWLCLFTVAHLFVTETVMRERMQLQTFANFVCKSYASGMGGGARRGSRDHRGKHGRAADRRPAAFLRRSRNPHALPWHVFSCFPARFPQT